MAKTITHKKPKQIFPIFYRPFLKAELPYELREKELDIYISTYISLHTYICNSSISITAINSRSISSSISSSISRRLKCPA